MFNNNPRINIILTVVLVILLVFLYMWIITPWYYMTIDATVKPPATTSNTADTSAKK